MERHANNKLIQNKFNTTNKTKLGERDHTAKRPTAQNFKAENKRDKQSPTRNQCRDLTMRPKNNAKPGYNTMSALKPRKPLKLLWQRLSAGDIEQKIRRKISVKNLRPTQTRGDLNNVTQRSSSRSEPAWREILIRKKFEKNLKSENLTGEASTSARAATIRLEATTKRFVETKEIKTTTSARSANFNEEEPIDEFKTFFESLFKYMESRVPAQEREFLQIEALKLKEFFERLKTYDHERAGVVEGALAPASSVVSLHASKSLQNTAVKRNTNRKSKFAAIPQSKGKNIEVGTQTSFLSASIESDRASNRSAEEPKQQIDKSTQVTAQEIFKWVSLQKLENRRTNDSGFHSIMGSQNGSLKQASSNSYQQVVSQRDIGSQTVHKERKLSNQINGLHKKICSKNIVSPSELDSLLQAKGEKKCKKIEDQRGLGSGTSTKKIFNPTELNSQSEQYSEMSSKDINKRDIGIEIKHVNIENQRDQSTSGNANNILSQHGFDSQRSNRSSFKSIGGQRNMDIEMNSKQIENKRDQGSILSGETLVSQPGFGSHINHGNNSKSMDNQSNINVKLNSERLENERERSNVVSSDQRELDSPSEHEHGSGLSSKDNGNQSVKDAELSSKQIKNQRVQGSLVEDKKNINQRQLDSLSDQGSKISTKTSENQHDMGSKQKLNSKISLKDAINTLDLDNQLKPSQKNPKKILSLNEVANQITSEKTNEQHENKNSEKVQNQQVDNTQTGLRDRICSDKTISPRSKLCKESANVTRDHGRHRNPNYRSRDIQTENQGTNANKQKSENTRQLGGQRVPNSESSSIKTLNQHEKDKVINPEVNQQRQSTNRKEHREELSSKMNVSFYETCTAVEVSSDYSSTKASYHSSNAYSIGNEEKFKQRKLDGRNGLDIYDNNESSSDIGSKIMKIVNLGEILSEIYNENLTESDHDTEYNDEFVVQKQELCSTRASEENLVKDHNETKVRKRQGGGESKAVREKPEVLEPQLIAAISQELENLENIKIEQMRNPNMNSLLRSTKLFYKRLKQQQRSRMDGVMENSTVRATSCTLLELKPISKTSNEISKPIPNLQIDSPLSEFKLFRPNHQSTILEKSLEMSKTILTAHSNLDEEVTTKQTPRHTIVKSTKETMPTQAESQGSHPSQTNLQLEIHSICKDLMNTKNNLALLKRDMEVETATIDEDDSVLEKQIIVSNQVLTPSLQQELLPTNLLIKRRIRQKEDFSSFFTDQLAKSTLAGIKQKVSETERKQQEEIESLLKEKPHVDENGLLHKLDENMEKMQATLINLGKHYNYLPIESTGQNSLLKWQRNDIQRPSILMKSFENCYPAKITACKTLELPAPDDHIDDDNEEMNNEICGALTINNENVSEYESNHENVNKYA